MPLKTNLLVFIIEDTRLAVDLDHVDRVVRAATLKPIPGAPASVLGLLNLNGTPIPVVSLRHKFKLAEKELDTTDEIIILKRNNSLLGLLVDEVESVTNVKSIPPIAESAHLSHLSGALQLNNEMVLVHDIDKFLSEAEDKDLATALNRSEAT